MEVYDKLIINWAPYLMFFNQPNFRSSVVNTDSRGFRFSGMMGKGDNLTKSKSVNIFSGGSTAFGVGSTSDKNTIEAGNQVKFENIIKAVQNTIQVIIWIEIPFLTFPNIATESVPIAPPIPMLNNKLSYVWKSPDFF